MGGGAHSGQSQPASRPPARLVRRCFRTRAMPSKDQGGEGSTTADGGAPAGAPRGGLARLLSWQAGAAPAAGKQAEPEAASAARSDFLAAAASAADAEEMQAVAAAAVSLQQQQPAEHQQRQGERDEQPPQQQQQQAEATAAAAAARSGAFSLYSWLTWGSNGSPAASSSDSDVEDGGAALAGAAELADGMAAAPSSDLGSSSGGGGGSSWRRWYGLGRAPRGGSGSFDDAEAAPQRSQQQQRVPLDHPALQLLRQRALAGSQPGQRRDPFKLGLVVEGGGMRGCVSGGALQALTDLGMRECFDAVYGSSAGAINSTYFLSGGPRPRAAPQRIDVVCLCGGGGLPLPSPPTCVAVCSPSLPGPLLCDSPARQSVWQEQPHARARWHACLWTVPLPT